MRNYIYIKSDKRFFAQEQNNLFPSLSFVLPAKWLVHQAIDVQRYGTEIYQIIANNNNYYYYYETSRVCRAYGGEKRRIQGFGGET